MADQPQMDINPFVQEYGQLRLVPLAAGAAGTSQGAGVSGGPAKQPTGKNAANDPAGVTKNPNPIDANKKIAADNPGKGNGSGVLPYVAGAAAAGAGAYALKRYLDSRTGKMVEEAVPATGAAQLPTVVPAQQASTELDPIVRPNWRYVTPETTGLPAVIPPRNVVPYVKPPTAAVTPEIAEAIARAIK